MKRALSSFIAAVCLATLPTAFAGAQGGVQIARAQAQARLSPHQIQPQQFHVYQSRIYADRRPIHLFGLNWSGLKTRDRAPHGLWAGRPLQDYFAQIKQAGFTAIRLPVSPDVLDDSKKVADWAQEAGYGPTGLRMLTQTVDAAARAGLWVVLGYNGHDSKVSGGDAPAPYARDGSYKVEDWLNDLARMSQFAQQRHYVVGIDLFNEPHGISWSEWKGLAERGGQQVLRYNPRLLVFVQGVAETRTDTAGYGAFWGSNFVEARRRPINNAMIPAHKLVLSPHVYGPDVYMMPYFKKAGYPRNMPAIWDAHFGHMASSNAVCAGEFGGKYRRGSKDANWQDAFVSYMNQRPGMSYCWFYWQFNPNSDDTGGVLGEDWQSLNSRKLSLLGRLKSAAR